MEVIQKPRAFTPKRLALVAGIVALLGSCAQAPSSQQPTQDNASATTVVKVDGSSTVFPITESVAGEFQKTRGDIKVELAVSGTGGGFRRFCAGETDISDASRPILTEEMEACRTAGVRYIELPIGFDALTVVVHPQNDWANDITLEELKKIWEPGAEGKITSWKQIRDSWPDRPLKLFGPGRDSGTFDYFTEAVVGQPKASRNDYTASEDDTVLVEGVSKDPNAMGYFGYAYYESSQNRLKKVGIDSGSGPVLPSRESVKNAEYHPLARPLFIYVNSQSLSSKPEVKAFVEYYLNNAERWVNDTGYVPLPDKGYELALTHLQQGKEGTVFEGQSQLNLKIEDLLQKEAKF
ncbi:MAG: PstS family phosphate ABC transporter substrate-binding protein [Coleofasciculus sp. S288]|nr:PstS family phosphate ABC transporter substrate-binding protein [Coleofasciculus sp. S288]